MTSENKVLHSVCWYSEDRFSSSVCMCGSVGVWAGVWVWSCLCICVWMWRRSIWSDNDVYTY